MSVTSKAFHCLPDMVLDCWVNKWENIAFDEIHRSSVPPPFSVVDDSYFLPTVQSTNFCPDDLRFPTCLKTFHRSRRCSQLPSKTSSKLPSAHSTWHLRRASWWAKRLNRAIESRYSCPSTFDYYSIPFNVWSTLCFIDLPQKVTYSSDPPLYSQKILFNESSTSIGHL